MLSPQSEEAEDIISYLRDYAAMFLFPLFSWSMKRNLKKKKKATDILEDEQNKQMNFPQCHRGFVVFFRKPSQSTGTKRA